MGGGFKHICWPYSVLPKVNVSLRGQGSILGADSLSDHSKGPSMSTSIELQIRIHYYNIFFFIILNIKDHIRIPCLKKCKILPILILMASLKQKGIKTLHQLNNQLANALHMTSTLSLKVNKVSRRRMKAAKLKSIAHNNEYLGMFIVIWNLFTVLKVTLFNIGGVMTCPNI